MTQFAATDFHLVNPVQLDNAFAALKEFEKQAFVPGGDPSMGGDPAGGGGGGGGGAPPPGDPSGGGDAGAPPPPAPGGGGGDLLLQKITALEQQMQQQQMQGGMGGGAGAGGKNPLAPKIDEKAVLSQILKLLARIVDHLKIPIPASEMVINTADQVALAQASQSGGAMPGMDPTAQAGMGGGAPQPMPGAGPPGGAPPPGAEKMGKDQVSGGFAFDGAGLGRVFNRASAIARVRGLQRS